MTLREDLVGIGSCNPKWHLMFKIKKKKNYFFFPGVNLHIYGSWNFSISFVHRQNWIIATSHTLRMRYFFILDNPYFPDTVYSGEKKSTQRDISLSYFRWRNCRSEQFAVADDSELPAWAGNLQTAVTSYKISLLSSKLSVIYLMRKPWMMCVGRRSALEACLKLSAVHWQNFLNTKF